MRLGRAAEPREALDARRRARRPAPPARSEPAAAGAGAPEPARRSAGQVGRRLRASSAVVGRRRRRRRSRRPASSTASSRRRRRRRRRRRSSSSSSARRPRRRRLVVVLGSSSVASSGIARRAHPTSRPLGMRRRVVVGWPRPVAPERGSTSADDDERRATRSARSGCRRTSSCPARSVSRTNRTTPYQMKKTSSRSPGPQPRAQRGSRARSATSAPSTPESDSYRNSGWKRGRLAGDSAHGYVRRRGGRSRSGCPTAASSAGRTAPG